MEIIKLQIKENDVWSFQGCYILNIKYNDISELSDYHFYTVNYFIDDSIRRMCIHPLPKLYFNTNGEYYSDENISKRIKIWFNNCKQKMEYGIDILGQTHGSDILDQYDKFLSGETWENSKKILYDLEYKKTTASRNIDNALNALKIALKINTEEVIKILYNSIKVSINEIFI